MAVGIDVNEYLRVIHKKIPAGTRAMQYAWRIVQWGRYTRAHIPELTASGEDLLLEGDNAAGFAGQWWR